jgi:septum formation protein
MKKIILASSSPRRKQLLESLGIKFHIAPSNIDEKLNPRLGPRKQAEELSRQKAEAIAHRFKDAIIIAADTMVVLDNELIGKPLSLAHGKQILKKLSGRDHVVVTGYTILDTATGKSITKSEETKMYLRKLSEKEIDAYIKKENILDKAGGYAIQGIGSILFERIEGDYFNAVGLPLCSVAQELKKFGILLL